MHRVARTVTILFALPLAGCVEDVKALKDQLQSANSRNATLTSSIGTLAEDALALAKTKDSIAAYEAFLKAAKKLDANCQQPKVKNDAFQAIWGLTEKADLIEGYVDFLARYPDAPSELLTKAHDKVCGIAFDLAVKKNTIEGYRAFLQQCPTSTKEKRKAALAKATALKEAEIAKELEGSKEPGLKETRKGVADRMYRDALKAYHNNSDDVTVRITFETFLNSKILENEDSTRQMLAHQAIMTRLAEIEKKMDDIRNSINQMREVILKEVSDSEKRITGQLAEIKSKQDELLRKESFPFGWDLKRSAMENFRELGVAALPFVARGAAGLLLR